MVGLLNMERTNQESDFSELRRRMAELSRSGGMVARMRPPGNVANDAVMAADADKHSTSPLLLGMLGQRGSQGSNSSVSGRQFVTVEESGGSLPRQNQDSQVPPKPLDPTQKPKSHGSRCNAKLLEGGVIIDAPAGFLAPRPRRHSVLSRHVTASSPANQTGADRAVEQKANVPDVVTTSQGPHAPALASTFVRSETGLSHRIVQGITRRSVWRAGSVFRHSIGDLQGSFNIMGSSGISTAKSLSTVVAGQPLSALLSTIRAKQISGAEGPCAAAASPHKTASPSVVLAAAQSALPGLTRRSARHRAYPAQPTHAAAREAPRDSQASGAGLAKWTLDVPQGPILRPPSSRKKSAVPAVKVNEDAIRAANALATAEAMRRAASGRSRGSGTAAGVGMGEPPSAIVPDVTSQPSSKQQRPHCKSSVGPKDIPTINIPKSQTPP